ncbi:TIGR04282 family arsenosugar biosynthesis glycosyltransferase [Zobellia galactanivorans]|uniref:TIGR04282 family arsenosugar biosynthesis glycosyltransferase n=1 Tax=Zobellia galactanivorans (strain DSM 12802 / CCUG 47099 / CIP 106680 / NCIMB 13871 / Dsij) TaxID=63186 RepID=UPI0020913791|nr:TIGR04282 family arsenosugar biosynthesis glycosyltransferase [Zobellia galactanivorans]
MSFLTPNEKQKEDATVNYTNIASKELLLIFTRNPQLGKCKTRLAATIGDQAALDIYRFLLGHTVKTTENLNTAKQVWYSEEIWTDDIWSPIIFDKKLQQGPDLGVRMAHAFQEGFASGFERIIVIGSDMYDLDQNDLQQAFSELKKNDFVIGPAQDGGYYLLGMNRFKPELFSNKAWGQESVLADTLENLKNEKHHILDERNDVDVYEDIQHIDAFRPYLKHLTS